MLDHSIKDIHGLVYQPGQYQETDVEHMLCLLVPLLVTVASTAAVLPADGYLAPSSSSAPAKRQAIVAVQRGPGPTVQYGSSSSEMILPGMTKKECIGGLGSPTASGPGGLGPLPGLPFLPGAEQHAERA